MVLLGSLVGSALNGNRYMVENIVRFIMRALDFVRRVVASAVAWLRRIWQAAQQLLSLGAIPGADEAAGPAQPAAPVERTEPAPAQREAPAVDATTDDVALGRMLASEDRSTPAKTVIGWITVQRARARKTTLHQMLTGGHGYGPQDRRAQGQGVLYASTAKAPSATDLELARGLLSGAVQPSAAIRAHAPGGWVERGQGTSDEQLIKLQDQWGEGIYGRIQGTKWFLYSRDTKPIKPLANQTASQALDQVVEVSATDPAVTAPKPAVAQSAWQALTAAQRA